MSRKFHNLNYLFFYLLISEDTWRICAGFVFAIICGPFVCQTRDNLNVFSESMIWIMIMVLGWALTAWPARVISKKIAITIKKLHGKINN